LIFKTGAESSGDVLSVEVSLVGLVVDGDRWVGVDLLEVLPSSVFSQDPVVRLEVSRDVEGVVDTFFDFLRVDIQEIEASIRVFFAEFQSKSNFCLHVDHVVVPVFIC